MKTKLVRNLMHVGLLTCRPGTPLGQVAVLLTQNKVHSLAVTDRDNRVLGIITDFDLLAGEWLSADQESLEAMRRMTAGDLMSTPVNTIEARTPAVEAAQQMLDLGISRLVVTENNKPVGMISVSDYVATLGSLLLGNHPKKVRDVMSMAILVCREETPIMSAARTMTLIGWRSVLVVNDQGKPQGSVSGLDLLEYCNGKIYEDVLVSEVMHPVITISADASLPEAVNVMIENHYHRLVVADPDNPERMPLGVISSYDIVAEMARPDSAWQV